MDRFSRLLSKFSAEKKAANLRSTMNKSVEAIEINGNGTTGYKIRAGKNRGKVLKHLKTDKNKL